MADRYWNPAGAGNWGDTSSWAASDGGGTGETVPTSADNVYFTSTNVNNCTINTTANCLDVDFTGGTGYTGTLSGSSALNIYGSMTLYSGMTRSYTGTITFAATSTGKTITMNTIALNGDVTFNGVGGGWTLQDAFSNGGSGDYITLTNGSLDTNGQTIICGGIISSNSNTRSLTLGASTITCSDSTPINFSTSTNLTFDAGTSSITCSNGGAQFKGGGKTFYIVIFSALSSSTNTNITGANTFTNLTLTKNASGASYGFQIAADQIVTGTLTANGNSESVRLLVRSDSRGTSQTITAATVSATYLDLQDITGAGAASWDLSAITGGAGDFGGNTDITFTTPTTRYWVGDGGNWSDGTNHWSTSSGGSAGASVPLIHDTVVFDANSFSSGSQTVTVDVHGTRVGAVDFTGVTNTPAFAVDSTTFFGSSITLVSGMTLSGTATGLFYTRGNNTFYTGGHDITFTQSYDMASGTITYGDAYTSTQSGGISHVSGTIDANDQTVTVVKYSGSNGTTVVMGSGDWVLTGTGTVWVVGSSQTVTPETSTIILSNASASTKTFSGQGKTYNDISLTGVDTGAFRFLGSNTFNDFAITPAITVLFTAGTTTTVTTFDGTGTLGNEITIGSITSSSHTLAKAGGGTITCDYLILSYSTATPGSTWLAGSNSTDNGNNSGWTFDDEFPPGPPVGSLMLLGVG